MNKQDRDIAREEDANRGEYNEILNYCVWLCSTPTHPFVTGARAGGGSPGVCDCEEAFKTPSSESGGHLDELWRTNMKALALKQLSVGIELDAPGRHWACVVVESLLRLVRCEKVPRGRQGIFGDIPLAPMSGLLLTSSRWLFAGIQGGPSRERRAVAETAGEDRIVKTYRAAAKPPLLSGV
ncbi:hypothetical protein QA641_38285 [Bradyrhizobium sp. CB1650]|uniref:hypothetical protein n=1 Tax=Bradyrhizobium sp. CB1650 TaxID=3039153 RepID=UPI002435392F|nr:hypothetical protein [Bradyrhizobium sp. CB1650]WGD51273.1 hypothetical protein QA641_38285 [Bradyrhizobium sp. CB1650]